MGRLMNIVTPLHKKTKRTYIDRMVDEKVNCMLKAKEYECNYWDGDQRYGEKKPAHQMHRNSPD